MDRVFGTELVTTVPDKYNDMKCRISFYNDGVTVTPIVIHPDHPPIRYNMKTQLWEEIINEGNSSETTSQDGEVSSE